MTVPACIYLGEVRFAYMAHLIVIAVRVKSFSNNKCDREDLGFEGSSCWALLPLSSSSPAHRQARTGASWVLHSWRLALNQGAGRLSVSVWFLFGIRRNVRMCTHCVSLHFREGL